MRLQKIAVSGFIDDFFTKKLFDRLEFVVHPDKSVLISTPAMTILGFVINFRKMSVKLTQQTEKNLKRLVNQLFSMKTPSIRFLTKVVGTIVSVFSVYAPLYCRALENDKIRVLGICKGDFDSHHPISDDAKDDLK